MTLGVTRRWTPAMCVCVGVMGLVLASSARAATLKVTTTADPLGAGDCASSDISCSLRQAVNTANAGDTVMLPPSAAPYTLSSTLGTLTFTKSMTLTGGGASTTAISGGGATGIISVQAPASVSVNNVTLEHGNASGNRGGAALVNAGATLALSSAVLSNNSAVNGGGAIEDLGTLTVRDSTITGNGTSTGEGGGIELIGGGTNSASAVVTDSVLSSNHANLSGGAIWAQSFTTGSASTSLTVRGSALINNSAGQTGGAIHGSGAGSAASLTVTNSTITGNTSVTGAGGLDIGNGPTADSFINDTIVANAALGSVASGGNVGVGGGASPRFENTIVAAGAAFSGPDCNGHATTLGHNLDDGTGCGFTAPGDLVNTAPMLRPLLSYGGPTPSIALLPGSPAIDGGSNTGCPATDQRGVPRPQGAACDIGAYEVAPPVLGTVGAIAVSTTTAALIAPVANPDVQPGTVAFQFGTSTSYGTTTPAQTLAASAPPAAFPLALTGLTPATTYHVRVVAQNPDGTVYGSDQQFTTAATPVSLPILAPAPPANEFTFGHTKVSAKGKLTVSLKAPDAGRFTAKATFSVRVKKVSHKGKKRVVKHITTTYTYGTGSATSSGMSTITLTLRLKGSAGRELRKLGHAKVTITVTFTPTGGTADKEKTTLTVRRSRKGKYT